jgi:ParB/RepB/Spo0J family partition protein
MMTTETIPVDDLFVDTVQSRDEPWTGDEQDQQLAASINNSGLLHDIIVRPAAQVGFEDAEHSIDSAYAIIAGSRRYYAAMEAGRERVPCKILEADDLEAAWRSLTENTDRKALSEQEIARQLHLVYEMVRPHTDITSCPECGTAVDGERGLSNHCHQTSCQLPSEDLQISDGGSPAPTVTDSDGRFLTERQAITYLAEGFLGRSGEDARSVVQGHLRTAELPPVLQALFKDPSERTAAETTALDNYNVDTTATLGSGEGKSGTSREVVALHRTVSEDLDDDALDPTNAVLRTVGSLQFEEMSEQELRRTLRSFRQEISDEIDVSEAADVQRQRFTETLQERSAELREIYDELEPVRPFKKVDVLAPETQHHSRWHARAMQRRDASGHGELVRQLYQERLETIAENEGWE